VFPIRELEGEVRTISALEMQEASTEAESRIAVLSPDYLHAPFTQPEGVAALAQDPMSKKGRLLPAFGFTSHHYIHRSRWVG